MSLITQATRCGAGTFAELLWSPFSVILQIAHAAQAYEGATMRWLAPDKNATAETLSLIQSFSKSET